MIFNNGEIGFEGRNVPLQSVARGWLNGAGCSNYFPLLATLLPLILEVRVPLCVRCRRASIIWLLPA